MSRYDVEYYVKLRDQMSTGLGKITKQTQGLNTAFSGLTKAAAAYASVAFGKEAVETYARLESQTKAIEFLSATTLENQKNQIFLAQTTNDLGLEMSAASEGFKSLTAAAKGTKLEGEAIREVFRQVSTASAVLGKSTEDQKGIFLALGQIMSKGKVSAEELRGQLGERLDGAFRIAADAMGLTTAELSKQLELGTIYSEDFLPKFAAQLEKVYGGGMDEARKNTQANLTAMNNLWTNFKKTAGESIAGVIGYLRPMIDSLNDTKSAAESYVAVAKNVESLDLSGVDLSKFKGGRFDEYNNYVYGIHALGQEFQNFTTILDAAVKEENNIDLLNKGIEYLKNQRLEGPIKDWDKLTIQIRLTEQALQGVLAEQEKIGQSQLAEARRVTSFGQSPVNGSLNDYKNSLKELTDLYENSPLNDLFVDVPGGGGGKVSKAFIKERILDLEKQISDQEKGLKGARGGRGSGGGSGTFLASRSPQYFTINIDTLGQITVENNTGSIKENLSAVRKLVAESLTEALNDVQLTARTR